MNEYDSILQLVINWLFWFLLGTIAAYGFFTLMEYINEQTDKD